MSAPPRHHTARSSRATLGRHVAVLAKAKGSPLMPWQQLASDVALELDDATGLPYYDTVVVSVQRQAGKTKLIGDVADHRCLYKPRARVWFTQQTGKDASTWMREEHFANLADARGLFREQGSPRCRYRISRRAGSEGVSWPLTGSTFYAFPPKRDAMHSKQSDLTFVDEAWAHDAAAGGDLRQAIRPTMATRPGAQLWVVSAGGTNGSDYLNEYLALGKLSLIDPDSRVCFIDYGIPEDADADDLDTITSWHPAYGLTQSLDSFRAARADFRNDPAGWARAYGNRPSAALTAPWPEHVWTECGGPAPDELPERVGLSVDITPKGDRGALSTGWRDDDGTPRVQLLYSGVPDRELAQLTRAVANRRDVPVAYDPRSPHTLALVDELGRNTSPDARDAVECVPVSGPQYASACAVFSKAVYQRELRHAHQAELDEAQRNAVPVPMLDGGFGWGRRSSGGSIAELVAATIALRAFGQLPAAKRKPVATMGRRR